MSDRLSLRHLLILIIVLNFALSDNTLNGSYMFTLQNPCIALTQGSWNMMSVQSEYELETLYVPVNNMAVQYSDTLTSSTGCVKYGVYNYFTLEIVVVAYYQGSYVQLSFKLSLTFDGVVYNFDETTMQIQTIPSFTAYGSISFDTGKK